MRAGNCPAGHLQETITPTTDLPVNYAHIPVANEEKV